MKLLQQLINKKLELHNELMLNRKYQRGIWQFYSCVSLSLGILKQKMEKEDIEERNFLWLKIMKSQIIPQRKFKQIQEFMKEDMVIIIKALDIIQEQEKQGFELGDIYHSGYAGILSYEMPD